MSTAKKTTGWMKSIMVAMVVGVALGFAPEVESQSSDETCHDGECQMICGAEAQTMCTYMQCGLATEMCMKAEGEPGIPSQN